MSSLVDKNVLSNVLVRVMTEVVSIVERTRKMKRIFIFERVLGDLKSNYSCFRIGRLSGRFQNS